MACPFANQTRRHYAITAKAAAKLGLGPLRKYGYVVRMMPPEVTEQKGIDIEGIGWWPWPKPVRIVRHLTGWYKYKADAVRRAEELNRDSGGAR